MSEEGQNLNITETILYPNGIVIPDQLTKIHLFQNVLLIWLDSNIDYNNIIELRRIVNTINTFTNTDQCIQFITSVKDENICMIISDSFAQHIIPRIHNIPEINSIFIFYNNQNPNEQWIRNWTKIKGTYTEIPSLYKAIKQVTQECEQNAISMSFISKTNDIINKQLDEFDNSFLYIQILKEILLSMKFEKQHLTEFITYCRDIFADNEDKLNDIQQLKRKYHHRTPIWWYTSEYFLSSMLNRALRIMNMDIIIKMGFFINDLHHNIKQLHLQQFIEQHVKNSFTVYRGQGMSMRNFQQITNAKNGLISFNNFLSTTKDQNLSLRFANNALTNPDMVGILFVMIINPSQSKFPFASINGIGYDILFSIHTIFRILNIKSLNENNRIFQVDLTLTSETDNDLHVLTNRIQEETINSNGWDRLGLFLLKIGHAEKAQQVFKIILNETMDENKKASIYDRLGMAKYEQEEYQEAIMYYEKSLDIYKKILPSNDSTLALSYRNIGVVYNNLDEYSKALSYYKNALNIEQNAVTSNHSNLAMFYSDIGEIYYNMGEYSKAASNYKKSLKNDKKVLPSNHIDLAKSYNNIGGMYDNMGDYLKALPYFEIVLDIQQQSLTPNHPDLAITYKNIGSVYSNMREYSQALSSYLRAFQIQQQSLPPDHPDLAMTYSNIGNVYNSMGEYPKALMSYVKAFQIQQQSLPPNHPDLVMVYNNLGLIHDQMGEYPKALSYFSKALEIEQEILPSDHPNLAITYNNIGNLYDAMGQNQKALSYHEKALEIRQKTLPENHPTLAKSHIARGIAYDNTGEYSKALSSYEKALEIQQQSLPPNHLDLAMTYNSIGLIYNNMGEHSKALSSHNKALEIQQESLQSNHPDLALSYNNIGNVYNNMGEYLDALSSYEKSLEIRQKLLPSNHPDLAMSYGHIGHVYLKLDEYAKALPFCVLAEGIGQRSLPPNHPHLQWYKKNLDLLKEKFTTG